MPLEQYYTHKHIYGSILIIFKYTVDALHYTHTMSSMIIHYSDVNECIDQHIGSVCAITL